MKRWVLIAVLGAEITRAPGLAETAEFRATPLRVPENGRSGFTLLGPEETGVRFTNQLSDAQLAKNQILEVGSGVALGDFDHDGFADIYLCAMTGGNRLYRNLGNWKFSDMTTPAIACEGQFSTGALFADVDGDADLDLLVNGIGAGTRLFMNDGAGAFTERTDAGLRRAHGSTSMAMADVEGDGALDLYVANYHTRTFKDSPPGLNVEAGYVGREFVIKPPGLFLPLFLKSGGVSLFERGEIDFLYRNNGTGRFAPLNWTNGTFIDAAGVALKEAPKDWGLAAAFRDLNGDRRPDLYVCNDFFHSPDQLWLNEGGKFRASPPAMLRHISMSSMAVDFADLNRDGHDDFLVLDMMSREHARRHRQRGSQIHLQVETPVRDPAFRPEYPRNMLYLSRGDGTYAEIAQYSGLEATDWSWSIVFLDADLDGFEDALITNGNLRDANDADRTKNRSAPGKPRFPPLESANLAFRNQGDLTFEECGAAWNFDAHGISHGMALGDLDNDGDLDVVVNNMRAAAGIYRNESAAPRVAVRLAGTAPNVQGIGARIELLGGAVPRQSQEIMSGGRYLSGDDPLRVFAAGESASGMTLQVKWPSGRMSRVEDVRANCLYEVREAGALATAASDSSTTYEKPYFENLSARLKQPHVENDFDDFLRQPALPRQLSRLGPGVLWRDLDEDGWEDLVLGGSRGAYSVIYLNDQKGGFKPLRRRDSLPQDQGASLAFSAAGGGLEFIAALSNYENAASTNPAVVRYDLQRGTQLPVLRARPWSAGALALGHLGTNMALFVGGRVRPGRYPEAADSQIYLREGGDWKLNEAASNALANVGLVSGATWADLDQDGQAELVLACEWGPVRILQWNSHGLEEVTRARGLEQYRGLWNGISAGDLNNDGKLDLIASNLGKNTRYERHRARPIRIYYGDWQGIGTTDLLEAYYEPALNTYAPFLALDRLRTACPVLAAKFASFAAYAEASVPVIIGKDESSASFLEANWLETTLFLNRGDYFEARPLPPEAQFAPAFGVSIGDMDGDGHEDVFLSQNFFGVEPETSRYDAGRGLWLRGDGSGRLDPIGGQLSGIALDGEQRGTALADFDNDGRIDLAVGQNNGPAGLFRNVRATPGLRVRLRGPVWNPDAAGATIRLEFGGRLGPARAVQIGSGYWSQESLVQVMAAPERPSAVWVRWPGARVTEHTISPEQKEITISEGEL